MSLRPLSPAETAVEVNGGLQIGASMTMETLARFPAAQAFPALQMALRSLIVSSAHREAKLCNVLTGEGEVQGLAAALIALDAELFVTGPIRERAISLRKYLSLDGLKISDDESITDFFLPKSSLPKSQSGSKESSNYQSVDYLRSGQALCGVAAWARKSGETLEEVRLVLAGCTQVPVSLKRVSAALRGRESTPSHIEAAIRKLGEERLTLYNPELTMGSHLFNLTKTLIKRAVIMI
ncbi:FAD binding domain-containing protein [Persicitalea jodogahamensis]